MAFRECGRAGHLTRYRFLPVTPEGEARLPDNWCFVIAASGVAAAKAGAVKERYNRLSAETAALIAAWNAGADDAEASLLDILLGAEDAADRLTRMVADHPNGSAMIRRLGQFREECLEIIPAAAMAVAAGDAARLGPLIDRSHALADTVLQNQIPETNHLVHRARQSGAIAASAFGAGFGGSVWALVRRDTAERFRGAWLADYLARFPQHAEAASTFAVLPADGAREVS